ncbi:hypothetical protein JDV02_003088 [Purpureocillium takamizusanense]|nr:uncharacterized protein JDV02_003088 [Purpureocillium takamizusanense]UNI16672.1 hypothetical protein JDV02_003088 [Purpureocillium takamizusanense]
MSSTSSSTNPRSRRTQSTGATSVTSRSRKSSAYDKNFEAHLADNGVYMNSRRSKPNNVKDIQRELAKERASLSPSKFSDGAFETFQRQNDDAVFESDVMATLVPRLCGTSGIHSKQNVLFTELKPIMDNSAVKPKPDFFDGARLEDLNKQLREDEVIRSTAVPSKHPRVPVVPNFFLEAKGPDGNAAVAQRQACYNGAYGAKAVRRLQNYGQTEPVYDSSAYTISSTYHAGTGTLQLYSHHITAPSAAEERPEYHMTQLKAYALTSDRETFVAGATAFRNARELAKRYRDTFIQTANMRTAPASTMDPAGVIVSCEETSTFAQHEIFESEDPSEYGAWQDADNALQELIAEGEAEATVMSRSLPAEEDSQYLSQESGPLENDDPSLSFASSFTSFDIEALRSKRPRQSLSPPTKTKRTFPSTMGQDANSDPVKPSPGSTTSTSSSSGKRQGERRRLR